jgi:hypothetical protein
VLHVHFFSANADPARRRRHSVGTVVAPLQRESYIARQVWREGALRLEDVRGGGGGLGQEPGLFMEARS